jgi:hypothetical protein
LLYNIIIYYYYLNENNQQEIMDTLNYYCGSDDIVEDDSMVDRVVYVLESQDASGGPSDERGGVAGVGANRKGSIHYAASSSHHAASSSDVMMAVAAATAAKPRQEDHQISANGIVSAVEGVSGSSGGSGFQDLSLALALAQSLNAAAQPLPPPLPQVAKRPRSPPLQDKPQRSVEDFSPQVRRYQQPQPQPQPASQLSPQPSPKPQPSPQQQPIQPQKPGKRVSSEQTLAVQGKVVHADALYATAPPVPKAANPRSFATAPAAQPASNVTAFKPTGGATAPSARATSRDAQGWDIEGEFDEEGGSRVSRLQSKPYFSRLAQRSGLSGGVLAPLVSAPTLSTATTRRHSAAPHSNNSGGVSLSRSLAASAAPSMNSAAVSSASSIAAVIAGSTLSSRAGAPAPSAAAAADDAQARFRAFAAEPRSAMPSRTESRGAVAPSRMSLALAPLNAVAAPTDERAEGGGDDENARSVNAAAAVPGASPMPYYMRDPSLAPVAASTRNEDLPAFLRVSAVAVASAPKAAAVRATVPLKPEEKKVSGSSPSGGDDDIAMFDADDEHDVQNVSTSIFFEGDGALPATPPCGGSVPPKIVHLSPTSGIDVKAPAGARGSWTAARRTASAAAAAAAEAAAAGLRPLPPPPPPPLLDKLIELRRRAVSDASLTLHFARSSAAAAARQPVASPAAKPVAASAWAGADEDVGLLGVGALTARPLPGLDPRHGRESSVLELVIGPPIAVRAAGGLLAWDASVADASCTEDSSGKRLVFAATRSALISATGVATAEALPAAIAGSTVRIFRSDNVPLIRSADGDWVAAHDFSERVDPVQGDAASLVLASHFEIA